MAGHLLNWIVFDHTRKHVIRIPETIPESKPVKQETSRTVILPQQ